MDRWVNTRTGEEFTVTAVSSSPAWSWPLERPACSKCGGAIKDATDGPYAACVACGHVADSDPGYS